MHATPTLPPGGRQQRRPPSPRPGRGRARIAAGVLAAALALPLAGPAPAGAAPASVSAATAATAATAGTAGSAGTATPSVRRPGPDRLPAVVNGVAPSLHPEGVAWDPTRRAFLVSSVRHGTVSVVTPGGDVTTLVSDPRMVSTFGVHVDRARGRLVVAYGDIGLGERSTPDTVERASGVGIFDLRTGRALHLVDLGATPGPHAANDLALDPAGNAYVTDPRSAEMYRVDPGGRASLLVSDQRFVSSGFGINGVAWHPGGYLLAVRYDTGALFRIDLPGHGRPGARASVREVTLDRPLVGGDGMVLAADGSLVVVTNAVSAPGRDAVQRVRPGPGWRSARVGTARPWPERGPSTATWTPSGLYVLAGRIDVLVAGGTDDTFVVRRASA